jgi:galactonate dehydratase
MFLSYSEEPVLPGDVAGIKLVSSSTSIPIATGERLFTRWQFNDLIEQQAVAIIQPDISHCGGIFEAKKIAAMAEARNIAVAPHCPLGPIALAAALQFDSCTHNFLCQEHVTLGHDYLKVPFQVKIEFIFFIMISQYYIFR